MASRGRWKRHEREIARAFGTERNPCNGSEHSDFETDHFAGEIKTRKALPQWFLDAMGQANTQAAEKDKTALLVLSLATQGRKSRRFVVMNFDDFVEGINDNHS